MKELIATFGAALLLAACADKHAFEITVPVADENKGQTVVLVNNQTGDTLAMATATDSVVTLKGTIEEPAFAVVICNSMPISPLIVEPGKITVDADKEYATGTVFNDQYAKLMEDVAAENADSNELLHDFFLNHAENPWSVALFQSFFYAADTEALDSLCAHHPELAENPNTAKIRQTFINKEQTDKGGKFIDFTLPNEKGVETSLASIVESAPLTIVDFWASWCGPCRAEIPNLISLHNQYKGRGLKVVGVDVWERNDEAGPRAAKEMKIPYTVLYGGTQEITDLYGILGIPTILLIDREGKILARDIRGEELAAEIADFFNK